jgi:hypothetical protein
MAKSEMMITISVESADIVLRALGLVKRMADAKISFEDEELPEEIKTLVSNSKDFVSSLEGKILGFRL